MNSKKKSISQKSTISIVIISAITGGITALQEHFNNGYLAKQNYTLDRRVEIHHYQAEIAALAKPLNRKTNPAGRQQQKIEQLQEPIADLVTTPVIAATGFALKQNQTLFLRSAVIQF